MAGNKNIIPLCKTIDWKKLKVIIKETVAFINKKYSKNGIDLNKFNTNKILVIVKNITLINFVWIIRISYPKFI